MKQALLAVSFGTSVPRERQDIEAVERGLAARGPGRAVRPPDPRPTIRRLPGGRGEPRSRPPPAPRPPIKF